MDLYTLDPLLRREEVIDLYESLIWTERYADSGDFEIVMDASSPGRNLLQPGQLLALQGSTRVMSVESVEKKLSSDGRNLVTVKGPSIEDVLNDRGSRPGQGSLAVYSTQAEPSTELKWRLVDIPGNIARAIFKSICIDGSFSSLDIIPHIANGNLYPTDNIAEPGVNVTVDVDLLSNVYTTVKSICDSYDLGFRLTRNGDNSQLFFNVYSGIDRTTRQSTYPAVIFSPNLDNMTGVTYLNTINGFKNVAYVFAPNGSAIVSPIGEDIVSGFDRRVLMVDASDITLPAGPALDIALIQKGLSELSLNKSLSGVDGEISQNSPFKYEIDYNLGDIVEMRNDEGVTSDVRVTEQIFTSDDNGDRSYPTLTTELFITPGSWFSSSGARNWNDATGTWSSYS